MSTPLIGVSKSILKIKELINHVANTCLNVLITGETGVGKEVVAQSLYAESARSSKNFEKINIITAVFHFTLGSVLFSAKFFNIKTEKR